MAKVLIANPPTLEGTGTFNRPIRFPTFNYATPVMHPPLLLAYAASYVRSRGHEVTFVDAQVQAISLDQFLLDVQRIRPDYLVFETSTPSFKSDCAVAEMAKQSAECKVVFVGPHVSAIPEEAMRSPVLDAVVLGEYELSLAEYIEKGGEDTAGICYRGTEGSLVVNPSRGYIADLDSIPFPARDLLPNYDYRDPIMLHPFTFVLSGRGCPYRCSFCNWPQLLSGRRYRVRSVGNIVDELEMLEHKYHFRSFLFNDDTFTANKEHAMQVCEEMMRRGLTLKWGCYTRADNDDMELLKTLKRAGCFILKAGVESGDETILAGVKKGYHLDKVRRGVAAMKAAGFHVHCTFVFGLPGETQQTIGKTISFAKELCPTTVQFSTAVPYPGTELFQYLKDNGYLKTENWDELMPMHRIFEYPHLTAVDMEKAVRRAYRSFFFRPAFIKTGFSKLLAEPTTVISNARQLARLVLGA